MPSEVLSQSFQTIPAGYIGSPGDVAAAVGSGDAAKIKKEYKKLARAKIVLAEAELKALK